MLIPTVSKKTLALLFACLSLASANSHRDLIVAPTTIFRSTQITNT